MDRTLTIAITFLMLALSACAFVSLDVAMRPAHYLRPGARGFGLKGLSQQLLPGLEKPTAYRIIGLAAALLTFGLAMLVFYYATTAALAR